MICKQFLLLRGVIAINIYIVKKITQKFYFWKTIALNIIFGGGGGGANF